MIYDWLQALMEKFHVEYSFSSLLIRFNLILLNIIPKHFASIFLVIAHVSQSIRLYVRPSDIAFFKKRSKDFSKILHECKIL